LTKRRHRDLVAVARTSREVDARRISIGPQAARRANRIVNARALRNSIQTGMMDRAHDVH
jgi:hypothetical protein